MDSPSATVGVSVPVRADAGSCAGGLVPWTGLLGMPWKHTAANTQHIVHAAMLKFHQIWCHAVQCNFTFMVFFGAIVQCHFAESWCMVPGCTVLCMLGRCVVC